MQMVFEPAKLEGVLIAPASKSEAHRRMICAGLSYEPVNLSGFMTSDDMEATCRCLKALGTDVTVQEDVITLQGRAHRPGLMPVLDCGESGSTLRFFVPIAMTAARGGMFRMHGRLSKRPMDVYRDLFVPSGVQWHMCAGADGPAELFVCGKLEAGRYVLPGDVSSQFVSGLLFALPLLPHESLLTVKPPVESAGYIRMTVESLVKSGIVIEEVAPYQWRIPGGQHYQAKSGHLHGDYSQAAVLLCAAALGHDVQVQGLSADTTQGDRAVLEHLKTLGAEVTEDENGITVRGGNLHGAELDVRDCPDVAPMLALVCQLSRGRSRLKGCGRLRLKECDRLAATVETLNFMGGKAWMDGDDIVITGVEKLRGGVSLPNYHDHRMVMLASIAAACAEEPVIVHGVEAINKSWPEYFNVYRDLGGKAE